LSNDQEIEFSAVTEDLDYELTENIRITGSYQEDMRYQSLPHFRCSFQHSV
jgi:hypothetical protein